MGPKIFSSAIDGLLAGNYSLTFSPLALHAYGCQLPTCTK